MLLIDHYAYNNRLLSVHPAEKGIFFALTITICLAMPSLYTSLAVIFLMAGAVMFLAGIPWRFYGKLLMLPGAFLIIGVTAVAVSVTCESQQFLWAIYLGDYAVGVTNVGLDTAANLFFRSLGAVSCLYFLSLTTPMTEMVGLLKKLCVPALVVELITLMYRLIFILLEAAGQIYTAQSSRLGYKNTRTGFTSLSQLVLSMFIKSYRQSQTMYDALVARCYDGQLHFIEDKRNWSARHVLVIILVDTALAAWALYAGGIL
ncbi:cobalt ECF transporter T component CbiQ [Desulfoscipio sp. XC116]|uniref:cobalt ECF transporter T component CbiQ n=1 Tax=Desulfoscipio sp. XC116 TaxID=3144975 RepID=UPI00325AB350